MSGRSSSSGGAPAPDDQKSDSPGAADPVPADPTEKALVVHPLIVRLVEHRRAKGWTQEQTAKRLQIPLNTLRGYECGNRNPGGANTEKILALVGLPKKARR